MAVRIVKSSPAADWSLALPCLAYVALLALYLSIIVLALFRSIRSPHDE
jgi:hypothetical protein